MIDLKMLEAFCKENGQSFKRLVNGWLRVNTAYTGKAAKDLLKRDLICKQEGRCPICGDEIHAELFKPIPSDIEVDHSKTVKEFTEEVLAGKESFKAAWIALHSTSNYRAVHSRCNAKRNEERPIST